MKKLIMNAIAATALLFGFASCSGDLHDVDNSPFAQTKSVFLIGGIADANADASQYISKVSKPTFSEPGYEVALKNGEFSFEFTYTGQDCWSAGAGNQAFTIMSNIDGGWDGCIARWGNAKVNVGSTGAISLSSENLVLTGLEAGTKYTLKVSLTSAAGTVSVEKGLSGVAMNIINVKDGLMKDAFDATANTSGDKYTYTYKVDAANAGKMSFVVRLGKDVWIPSAKADLSKGNVTVATPTRFDKVSKIEYPITFEYEAWSFGYELSFEYDTTSSSLVVSASKLSGMYIFGDFNGWSWGAMNPEDEEGKVWSYPISDVSSIQIAGVNTERGWTDSYRNGIGTAEVSFSADKNYDMFTEKKGGDSNNNMKLGGFDTSKSYKLIFTVLGDGKASVSIKENK